MTWERIRTLLESDDQRCRRFALQKCSRALTSSTLPEPETDAIETDVDSLLAGHFDQLPTGVGGSPGRMQNGPNLHLRDTGEAQELTASLLKCLRASLHTPKRDAHDIRFTREIGNALEERDRKEFLASPTSTPRGLSNGGDPNSSGSLAGILVNAALGSPKTDYESVHGALICIDRISMEWPVQVYSSHTTCISHTVRFTCFTQDDHF